MKIDVLYKNGHSEIINIPKDFTKEMFGDLVNLVESAFNSNSGSGYFTLTQSGSVDIIKLSEVVRIKIYEGDSD